MSYLRYAVRRTALAVVSVYLVVTVVFVGATLSPNFYLQALIEQMRRRGATQERIQAFRRTYRERRNLDEPLLERYVDWLIDVPTLDWGYSYSQEAPVFDLVVRYTSHTLAYLLPALLLALCIGTAIGFYGGVNPDGFGDGVGRLFGYALLGLPNIFLAFAVAAIAGPSVEWAFIRVRADIGTFSPAWESWSFATPERFLLPAAILATSLVAGYLQYTRSATLEYVDTPVTKLLRAKGAAASTILEHLLRNVSITLVSVFFTEMLVVLSFNIYLVEYLYRIPGLGLLTMRAAYRQEVPLLMGVTMVLVVAGVLGNWLQDLVYGLLDPRVREGQSR